MRKWATIALLLASTAQAADVASIGTHRGMWEMAYGDVYYRVVGEVENKSAKPVKYVKLQIDLLDEGGKVVKTLEGYNQKAEFLAGVDATDGIDTGETAEPFEKKLERVEAIPAGGKDSFRIGIGKNDIPKKPKFTSYKVRIVETK